MSKLSCEIIRDLLPSYVDELTSEVTNRNIEEHFEECDSCKRIYDSMKMPTEDKQQEKAEEVKEINFLKKTKKNFAKRLVLSGLFLVVAMIAAVMLLRANLDSNTKLSMDDFKLEVGEKALSLAYEGGDNVIVTNYKVDEADGVLHVTYKTVAKSPWKKQSDILEHSSIDEIKEVWLEDQLIWADDIRISQMIQDVFNAAHPYMGDMSANAQTAKALKISNTMGSFTNELVSDETQPLTWIITLDRVMTESQATNTLQKGQSYASLMLATIGNLDQVEFRIYTDNEKENFFSKIYSREELDGTLISVDSLAEAGKSLVSLQKLVNEYDINLLASNNMVAEVENTAVEGNLKEYTKNADGTWTCEGYTYRYRLVITGRMPNAECDSTFVYLSNIEEISFHQAYMSAGLSNNMDDYYDAKDAVLVDWK